MDYDVRDVALSRIDAQDKTFLISTRSEIEPLKVSIRSIGLITPPILLAEQNHYLIICGFSRIEACRQLGWTAVRANCISDPSQKRRCALAAIGDSALQRPLNSVEQARACHLLAQYFPDPHEWVAQAQSVGLQINTEMVEKLRQVHAMDPCVHRGLMDGSLALPTALRLHTMIDRNASVALVELLLELRLSLNRQREVLDWLEGIQHREKISLLAILADESILQWRGDPNLDPLRKSQLIRDHIKRRRFPTITRCEQRYAQTVKRMSVPVGVELIPPPNFEGQTFSLKIDFNSPNELKLRLAEIERLQKLPEFQDLLDQKSIY